jgi:hypothetical protein
MNLSKKMEVQKAINTIHKFLHCIDNYHNDNNSSQKFTDLFTENATFIFKQRNLLKQKQGLKGLCEFMGDKFKGYNHLEYNIVLERVDESTFNNSSYWAAYNLGQMTAIGRHFDVLKLVGQEWLFEERTVTLTWTAEAGNL